MAQSGAATPAAADASNKKRRACESTSAGKSHEGHDEEMEVLVSALPIPFMNGRPVDINTLTVDQLQKFFSYVYSSFYHTTLPSSSTSSSEIEKPPWWSIFVTFDSSLQLRPGFYENWHQKYIVDLLWRFYDFCGYSRLLESNIVFPKANKLQNRSKGDLFKSLPSPERKLVLVGHRLVPTYDLIQLTEVKQQEALELEQPMEASLKVDSRDPGGVNDQAKSPIKNEETKNQTKKINIAIPQINLSKPEMETTKTSNLLPQKASKDVINNLEKVSKNNKRSSPKDHKDHEKEAFLTSLGLIGVAQVKSVSSSPAPLPSPSSSPVGTCSRALRKLPSRNPLLMLIQDNPFLPITSGPGQRLLSLYGEKVVHTYPPPYEAYCQTDFDISRACKKKAKLSENPIVTDEIIIKNGINPHIYSYGRGKLQRTKRYQELVVGVNQRNWPALNKCKEARVQMKQRVNPPRSTSSLKKQIEVKHDKGKTSCFVRAINATFVCPPPVQLIDFMKQPPRNVEFMNYIKELIKRKAPQL